jgi:hypothetical protein
MIQQIEKATHSIEQNIYKPYTLLKVNIQYIKGMK